MQGTQICPQGRGVIYFILRETVDIMKFCQHEVFQVTSSGIRVVNVKPAGKKEVIVTLKGVHPNTKDDKLGLSWAKLSYCWGCWWWVEDVD